MPSRKATRPAVFQFESSGQCASHWRQVKRRCFEALIRPSSRCNRPGPECSYIPSYGKRKEAGQEAGELPSTSDQAARAILLLRDIETSAGSLPC